MLKELGLQLQLRVRLVFLPPLRDFPSGIGDNELAPSTGEQAAELAAKTQRLGGGLGCHPFLARQVRAGDGAALDAAPDGGSLNKGPLALEACAVSRERPLATRGR